MNRMSQSVKRAIEECGLSRYAISKATGVFEGTLSRFMADKADMTLDTLDKLAGVIGVELVVKQPSVKGKGR